MVTGALIASTLFAFGLGFTVASMSTTKVETRVDHGTVTATHANGWIEPVPNNTSRSSPIYTPPGPATNNRADAQALARKTLGDYSRYIQSALRPDLFITASRYYGWPGLCEADAISVAPPAYGGVTTKRLFLVVGSFTSPKVVTDRRKAGYAEYRHWEEAIKANCARREASLGWFTAHGAEPWDAARLFDSTIAAARTGTPDFPVLCAKAPSADKSICNDPRGTLSRLNPANIATVESEFTTDQNVQHKIITVSTHGDPRYYLVVIRQDTPFAPNAPIEWVTRSVEIGLTSPPVVN